MAAPSAGPLVRTVLDDLREENEDLDRIVGGLPPDAWRAATPAPGWSIAHQIGHLAWTDGWALLAVTDAERFTGEADRLRSALGEHVDEGAETGAADRPGVLLHRWRDGRAALWEALLGAPVGDRLPWFGTAMSVASMATARLMETWAHGQDIADALAVVRTPTARLRHVARIGVRTRDHAFRVRGLRAPAEAFRVELTAPDGRARWIHGPDGAAQSVTGPALDFCLLVTQRRARADCAVTAHGPDADRWLDLAQAFAGPPGTGRPPQRPAGADRA